MSTRMQAYLEGTCVVLLCRNTGTKPHTFFMAKCCLRTTQEELLHLLQLCEVRSSTLG